MFFDELADDVAAVIARCEEELALSRLREPVPAAGPVSGRALCEAVGLLGWRSDFPYLPVALPADSAADHREALPPPVR